MPCCTDQLMVSPLLDKVSLMAAPLPAGLNRCCTAVAPESTLCETSVVMPTVRPATTAVINQVRRRRVQFLDVVGAFGRSASDELCLAWAAVRERVHTDCPVLRSEQPGKQRSFELQTAAQVRRQPEVNGLLGRSQCHRRSVHELSRPCGCCGQYLIDRYHVIDQANSLRLSGVHRPTGKDQLLRPCGTDQSGEPLCATGTWDHAQQNLR